MRRLGVIASSAPPPLPPSLRDFTTVSDFFGSPFNLTRPDYVPGDLLLAVLACPISAEFGSTFSPPAGWSNAFSFSHVGPFFDEMQIVGFYKFSDASEPSSYSFTHNMFSTEAAASLMSLSDAAGIHGVAAIKDFYEFAFNETQLAPGPSSGSSSDPIRLDIYSAIGFFETETKYNLSTYTGNIDEEYSVPTSGGVVHFIFNNSGSLAPTSMDFELIADAVGIGVSLLVTSKY